MESEIERRQKNKEAINNILEVAHDIAKKRLNIVDNKDIKNDIKDEDIINALNLLHDKYPNQIIISCTKQTKNTKYTLEKTKFFLSKQYKVSNFISSLRKKLNLKEQENIYLFVNNILLKGDMIFEELYDKHKSNDGMLHIKYHNLETFG
jgi:GABA(A) receptor-associated protein